MATTIGAPPSEVWPWPARMGCDRAGWYSWDRLDNGGRPSAEAIHPEWQHIATGDRLASLPDGSACFAVAALEPERFLGPRATLDIRGRPVVPDGPKPRFYTDSPWGFLLQELPGGGTRLVISGYDAPAPHPLHAVVNFLFWEPDHRVMQTRQWSNLRRRAERAQPQPHAGTLRA